MMSIQVLMHAGPEGMTIAEIIERANSLGLTDPAWEVTSSRKSNLSSVRLYRLTRGQPLKLHRCTGNACLRHQLLLEIVLRAASCSQHKAGNGDTLSPDAGSATS